ncbi:hypothetical protein GWI33_017136 [Rhynchophorus ferrugineus]|uniref:Uncharacterized protein n=1 Tax=Rhynchophorus ferrugineus TaxID=354439 RepID=A0A834HZP6_RHYFE|nr:hypothetical protein GWI33_017136 [Rhynchophorus ferrugineus]
MTVQKKGCSIPIRELTLSFSMFTSPTALRLPPGPPGDILSTSPSPSGYNYRAYLHVRQSTATPSARRDRYLKPTTTNSKIENAV